MIRLSREIRFAIVSPEHTQSGKPTNSWAGWPTTDWVVPHLAIQCVVAGPPDPVTGYLCNIKIIDDLIRSIVTDHVIPNYNRQQTAAELVSNVYRHAIERWKLEPEIVSISLLMSPYTRYCIATEPNKMTDHSTTPHQVQLTQQFEFSAAHRLHCDQLSDQENRDLFGKCNNLEGHGHNYVVEITVSSSNESTNGQIISMHQFESIVKQTVIDRLDHKHLNRDIDYFAEINPTVENIAIAIYNWLQDEFGSTKLSRVRVYETPKTWAEYCGA